MLSFKFTVTVSVAPTTVDIFVPPAISKVLPLTIVWSVPESPVRVKLSTYLPSKSTVKSDNAPVLPSVNTPLAVLNATLST